MSSIDDRIVDMQFNNASFEKNVGSSIKSLEHLNKALELKDASKGLNSVMVAVNAIDLNQIVNGVQNISGKFNALGAIGLSVINKLTGALMGFAGNSVASIMEPLIEGGKRRAQNIEQAKFMIEGLGKSWNKLYKDMDYAVSGSAFGIDQAAKAASQLSASSVKAGADMKASLRGISGVASMTSSSYDDIAQVFTTVAGNGRLMASELNRISARGLNAAQAIADYWNKTHKGAKVTEKDIREMTSKGKIDFQTFANAMDAAFGAQAVKANELYSGSLSNVRAALSRIGEKLVTPVFEKQKGIFNQLRLVINSLNTALTPFYDLWSKIQKESGKSWVSILKETEKAIGILSNSPNEARAKAQAQYTKDYNKAKKEYEQAMNRHNDLGEKKPKKPKIIKEYEKEQEALKKAKEKQQKADKKAEEKYQKALAKYKKYGGEKPVKPVAAGTTQEQTDFTRAIAATTDALRVFNNTAKRVFTAVNEAFVEAFPKDSSAKTLILTLAQAIQKFAYWLQPTNKQLESFKKGLVGFFTVVKLVFTIVKNAFQAIPSLIQVVISLFGLLGAVFKPVLDLLSQLATSFFSMFKGAGEGVDVVKTLNDALTWLREDGLGKIIEILGNATKAITDFWNGMGSGDGGNLFAGFDPFSGMLEKLHGFGATMSTFFQNAWIWAKGIYESIKAAMGQFGSGAGGFFTGIGQTIQQIGVFLGQLLNDVKGGMSELFKGFDWSTLLAGLSSGAFIAMLVKVVRGIMDFFKVARQAGDFMDLLKSGIIDGLTSLQGAIDRFGEETKSDKILKISTALKQFAIAIGILAAAFWLLSMVDIENVGSAVGGMITATTALVGGLLAMSKVAGSEGVVKMPAIAFALTLLGASLLLLAKAIQIFASVDPDRLFPSLAALGVGLLFMVGALETLAKDPKKFVGAAFAMNLLAGAMVILAGAIALLGVMPLDMLVQGGIALAGILLLVTLFAAVPSENVLKAGVAVGILAGSLMVMVGAIAILGAMPMDMLIQGGIALAVMITGLVVAVNLLKGAESGAAAMLAIAAALAILVIPIKVFAGMDAVALEQGIVATLIMVAGLVLAANLMQKTMPGAAAMIVVAIAIGILAAAVWVLAQLPADQVFAVLQNLAIGLGILIGAAALAQMVTAGLFILAGAILAIGAAVALAGLGIVLFSMGLSTIGIAAQAAIPGLKAFAEGASEMAPHLLAMVGLAVALGVLAAAVLALGVAFVTLGVGLVAVGAGMALLAAFGGVGAIAVLALWKALEPLVWQVIQIGALGGAFVVLGAGLIAVGAGLALTAAGAVLLAVGMLAVMGAGFAFSAMIDSVRMALERFIPISDRLNGMTSSLQAFGNSFRTLNTTLSGLVSNLNSVSGSVSRVISEIQTNMTRIPMAVMIANQQTQISLNMLIAMFNITAALIGAALENVGSAIRSKVPTITGALDDIATEFILFGEYLAKQGPVLGDSAKKAVSNIGPSMQTTLKPVGATLKSQSSSIGKNVVDGLISGINNNVGRVVSAARAMAQRIIKGIKDEFEIKSPSKVMEQIGKFVKEGFYEGLTGFEKEPLHRVQEAVKTMKEELKEGIQTALDEIKALNSQITKLEKKKKKTKKDKNALKNAKKERKELQKIQKNSEAALNKLDGTLKDQQNKLMEVSDKYDDVVDKLKDATQALTDAENELADAQKSYTEQFSKLPEFADEGDLINTYLDDLEKQIEATKKFAEDLAYIRGLGLDDKMYKKLLEQGVEAQPFIDSLIESGQSGVDEINKLHKELDDAASALGTTAAKELYQAGVDIARGLVEGLQKEEADLKAEMEKLGKAMVEAIKKELGIKSPSTIFAEVGGYSMIGLMHGIQKYIPALERTSEEVGDTAIDGLRKAIDEIGEVVYGEMDMSPVIRPVLDLSDVENSAKQLGSVFGSKSIDVGSVYADASNIAFATRQRELLNEQQGETVGAGDSVTFIQNNTSPKAISNIDLYRQTRNQLSGIKKGLPQ